MRTTATEPRSTVSSKKWSGTKVAWSMSAMDAGAPAEGMPRRCRRVATSLAKGRSVRVVMRSPGCPKAAIEPVSSGVSAMKNPSR